MIENIKFNKTDIHMENEKLVVYVDDDISIYYSPIKGINFSNGEELVELTCDSQLFLLTEILNVIKKDKTFDDMIKNIEKDIKMSNKHNISINEYCITKQLVINDDFYVLNNENDCCIYDFIETAKFFNINKENAVQLYNNINCSIDTRMIVDKLMYENKIFNISKYKKIATLSPRYSIIVDYAIYDNLENKIVGKCKSYNESLSKLETIVNSITGLKYSLCKRKYDSKWQVTFVDGRIINIAAGDISSAIYQLKMLYEPLDEVIKLECLPE